MRDAGRSLILAASLALASFTPRQRLPRATRAAAGLVSPTATFPFAFEDGRVYIPVQLAHDTTQRWFIFDTGAPEAIIVDAGTAARLNLAPKDAAAFTGAGSREMHTGRAARSRCRSVGSRCRHPSSP